MIILRTEEGKTLLLSNNEENKFSKSIDNNGNILFVYHENFDIIICKCDVGEEYNVVSQLLGKLIKEFQDTDDELEIDIESIKSFYKKYLHIGYNPIHISNAVEIIKNNLFKDPITKHNKFDYDKYVKDRYIDIFYDDDKFTLDQIVKGMNIYYTDDKITAGTINNNSLRISNLDKDSLYKIVHLVRELNKLKEGEKYD